MQAASEDGRRALLAGAFLFIGGIWGLLSIPIAEGMNSSYNVSTDSVSGLGVPYFSHLPVTCNTLPACAVPVQPSSAVIVLSFFVSGIFALLGGYLLRKATDHKLFNLGVALVGVFLFLIGVSYIPFYLGTPTIDVINVMGGLHDVGSIGAFVMVFLLAVFAYRFTRGLFRYLSPTLGAVILASTLFFMSGNFLGVVSAGLTLAPATLLMLFVGPGLGRLVTRNGPKPTMVLGSCIAIAGLLLFIVRRATPMDVTLAAAISLMGAISIIIPIVNMISVSLPRETVATGLGLNTMLRNMGGAVGPVIATTLMTTYTLTAFGMKGPSSTAFDAIFYLAIALMALAILLSLAAKNYTFNKKT